MKVRKAAPGDEHVIMDLVQQLADYENEPDAVANTPERLRKDMFEDKVCDAFVLEDNEEVIGFALYYISYSTWKGPCIYLEDLFIKPESRRSGAGGLLFDAVVNHAREQKVARMDWQVLDWNEMAISFYKKKGAMLDPEWINGRLFFPENE